MNEQLLIAIENAANNCLITGEDSTWSFEGGQVTVTREGRVLIERG